MGRSGRWTVRRGAALVVAGGLLLAGCSRLGGDPAPVVATGTATPTPTPSPSPALPAAAKKPTRSSAQAFVKYWFSAYNHATWAQVPAELKPISDSKCAFCNRAMQTVETLKAQTRRVEGGRITVTEAKVTLGTPTKGMRLDLVYDQAASTILDATGAKVASGPASKAAKMIVAVKWTGKQWIVLDVVLLS